MWLAAFLLGVASFSEEGRKKKVHFPFKNAKYTLEKLAVQLFGEFFSGFGPRNSYGA